MSSAPRPGPHDPAARGGAVGNRVLHLAFGSPLAFLTSIKYTGRMPKNQVIRLYVRQGTVDNPGLLVEVSDAHSDVIFRVFPTLALTDVWLKQNRYEWVVGSKGLWKKP